MKNIMLFFIFINTLSFALDNYPSKPIDFVVGLGKGGSADRMARVMATFLQKELNTPIKVINIKKNASLSAVNYLLNKPQDGYTIFSSAIFPYFLNVIANNKNLTLNDFKVINLQWFEQDFIVVDKSSKFNTIIELLNYIKFNPKKLRISVINKSSGSILFKILLKKFNISLDRVLFKNFEGGARARNSLLSGESDVLVIASQGSEGYRKDIKVLAISSQKRSKRWDAPTLNEALNVTGIQMPIINGPIRGFVVTRKFQEDYPQRYKILKNAIKKSLSRRKVQKKLKMNNIGYSWLGSKKSTQIIKKLYDTLKENYSLTNN